MTTPQVNRILAPATRPRIIVAVADWTDRDRLTLVIEHARPQYEVVQVPPDGLDLLTSAFKPDFVICSDASATIEALVPTILVMDVHQPEFPRAALLYHDNNSRVINGPSIGDILQLLDQCLSVRST